MLHRPAIRIRTLFAVAALACCFACVLGACAAVPSGAADRVEGAPASYGEPLYDWGGVTGETITVWGDETDVTRPYLVRAFARYEEQTGNDIVLTAFPKEELSARLVAAFGDSEGAAEQPDVVLSYGGANLKALDPAESFYDFIDAPWIDDLTDTALTQAIYDGMVVGLPHWEASTSGTLYNKRLFEELGLSVPSTQQEFLATCEALLARGVVPLYLPYEDGSMMLYQFPLDSVVKEAATLDALNDGSLSYAQMPEMRAIVDWYKTMADRGFLGEGYERNGWDGMDEAMKSGSHAMMLCWDTWLYTDFTGDPDDFGIMPAFVGVPEEGTYEGPNLSLVMANKRSPRLEAAIDLVTFMADPCNYNVAFEGIYTAPVFNNQAGSVSTPQFLEKENEIERLFNESTAWLRIEGFSQTDADFIQRYLSDELTVDECLQAMDEARLARSTGKGA